MDINLQKYKGATLVISPILEKNAVTRAQILLTDKVDGKLDSEVTSFQFNSNLTHNSKSSDHFLFLKRFTVKLTDLANH